MRIAELYSHLNGEEYLLVKRPKLYAEIKSVISAVKAPKFRTKISKEKTMRGKRLYSPSSLNAEFKRLFKKQSWQGETYHYYVTTDRAYLDRLVGLPLEKQKDFLVSKGVTHPIKSYKQTDFVKEQVAVEVQFGKYSFVAYDLFVKHLLFYSGGVIDVGVEILPMKQMVQERSGGRLMSTGVAYFEGEVYNVLRHGRSNPPVPLVVLGVVP